MLQFVLNVKKPKNRLISAILFFVFFSGVHVFFSLHLAVEKNRGVSFGMYFTGIEWIVFVILCFLGYLLVNNFSWGLYMVWVGGLINTINRLITGYVYDYFNLGLVSNNIADFLIFVGIVLFLFRNEYKS